MVLLKSFNYIASESAVILILGSMPGEESLQRQQYYAHPRNLFWDIMGQMYDFDKNLPYHERLTQLKHNGIALWDVLSKCRRKGSLDSNIDISSTEPNDFGEFFQTTVTFTLSFLTGERPKSYFVVLC